MNSKTAACRSEMLLRAMADVARTMELKLTLVCLGKPDIESALAALASHMHVLHLGHLANVADLIGLQEDLRVFQSYRVHFRDYLFLQTVN